MEKVEIGEDLRPEVRIGRTTGANEREGEGRFPDDRADPRSPLAHHRTQNESKGICASHSSGVGTGILGMSPLPLLTGPFRHYGDDRSSAMGIPISSKNASRSTISDRSEVDVEEGVPCSLR